MNNLILNINFMNKRLIQEVTQKTIKRLLKEEYDKREDISAQLGHLRSNMFDLSEEGLGVVSFDYDPNTNELYAGYATNAGIPKQFVIEYDDDFDLDSNLQALVDKIFEESSITENKHLTEAVGSRKQVSRDQMIDILNAQDDDPKSQGKFVSVTYVKPVSVYKTKRNWRSDEVQAALVKYKDRGEEDWHKNLTAFNQADAKGKNPVSTVIVTQRYLLHWSSQERLAKTAADYSEKLHNLRMKNGIGLDSAGMLGDNHNQRQKSDTGAQFNQTDRLSRDFNMAGSKTKTTAYFCDENGNIITALPSEVLKSMTKQAVYNKPEKAVTDVLNGEALEAYMKAKAELDKMYNPKNLLLDRILCIAASVNGESYYFINDKLMTPISKDGNVNVNQGEMVKIAEDQLGETFNEIL